VKFKDILRATKLNVVGAGDYVKARCPFHRGSGGRTLWISTETGHWGCWSTRCQYNPVGGSLAELLVLRGFRWPDAVALEAGCEFDEYDREADDPARKIRIREPHLALWDVNWDLAEQVTRAVEATGGEYANAHLPLWQWCPTSVRPGMVEHDYWFHLKWMLRTRGVSPDALTTMRVGWAPEHQAFSFPLRRIASGDLIGWTKRDPFKPGYYTSGTHLTKAHPDWLLMRIDKKDCMWGAVELREKIAEGGPVVLVEGQIDQLKVLGAGYAALAISGKKLTEEQAAYLGSLGNPIILWPDNDMDGLLSARVTAAALLYKQNFSVVTQFFGRKDAGDLSTLQIQSSVCNAVPGVEFLSQWSNLLTQIPVD